MKKLPADVAVAQLLRALEHEMQALSHYITSMKGTLRRIAHAAASFDEHSCVLC